MIKILVASALVVVLWRAIERKAVTEDWDEFTREANRKAAEPRKSSRRQL